MLTREVLPRTRTVAPVSLAWYSARMNLMICQCRARQLLDAGRFGDLWRHVLGPLGRIDEETLVVDGDAVAGVGSGRHRQHLLKDDHR
jgi:hypothetical protein